MKSRDDGWVRQESWSCAETGVTYRAAANASNVSAGQVLLGASPEELARVYARR
jgi:hypothetical protein